MLIDHLVTFPSGGDGLLMPSPRDWSLPTSTLFPSYPCEDHDDHGGDSNGLVGGDDDGDNVTGDNDGGRGEQEKVSTKGYIIFVIKPTSSRSKTIFQL